MHILHILDDTGLGGVTRLLDAVTTALEGADRHERLICRTRLRLPPRITADVVVVHFTLSWLKLPYLAALRLRAPNARIVLVEHSYTGAFEAMCVPAPGRFRAMLRLAYRIPDAVVAVSAGQARWMTGARLLPQDRVRIIPCVNDLAAFTSLSLPVSAGGPMRLGAFGRFDRQKGFETLVAAMRLVPPDVARLDLAGYGPAEGALREMAAGLSHVVVHGRVDPVQFLDTVDAVAIPSRWEAGAVVCWEARATGRPLIVSDVDGLPEQVPPRIGLVTPPDDVERLAAAINELARSDRAAMAREARRSTEGAFPAALRLWRNVLTGGHDERAHA